MEIEYKTNVVRELDRAIEASGDGKVISRVYLTRSEFNELLSDAHLVADNLYQTQGSPRTTKYRGVEIIEQNSKGGMICG